MAKFKDLTGQKFSRLTVNKYIGRSNGKSKHSVWECICECGNIKNIVSTSLTRDLTKSCGCYHIENAGNNQKQLKEGEASFNLLLGSYKKGAKKRNLNWSLTIEQFRELTKNNCYYCGVEPKQFIKRNDLNGYYIHNGVDRLINSMGYYKENTVSCCGICNWLKNTMNEDNFLNHITRIYNYRKNKK